MDINTAFPSTYLRHADLNGRVFKVAVKTVAMEDVGGGDHKPVVYFEKADKGLVLNKTNAMSIAQAYGPNTDGWTGKAIELYPDTTMYQGRPTPCIRVRPFYPSASNGATLGQPPASAPAPLVNDANFDDTIPF